jgi:hypothetical protein
MTENFPQFEPLSVRPEEETEDKEIWQPSWNCFCCQDTGKVQAHLVRLVMPNYDYNRDRLPMCQLCSCGDKLYHLTEFGVIDTRFETMLCRKLDQIAREEWRNATTEQFAITKQRIGLVTDEVAQAHSLRKKNRTQNDNREVQQHKAEIEAKEYAAAVGGDDE